jgi:hypothetical protein
VATVSEDWQLACERYSPSPPATTSCSTCWVWMAGQCCGRQQPTGQTALA